MEISPYMLSLLLLYSFLFGMAAGVFNDINRITRSFLGIKYSKKGFSKLYEISFPLIGKLSSSNSDKKIKKTAISVLIFFQDIFLFIFIACGAVILNYYFNKGQFRLYTIAAIAAGFGIYYFTVGRIIMLFSEAIIFFIKVALRIVFYIILKPFLVVGRCALKISSAIYKKLFTAIAKKKIIRYNKRKQAELLALSEKGFIDQEISW